MISIPACRLAAALTVSEGGIIGLETLIELAINQFELFELILLLKLDKRLPVEQFQAAVSPSTVPSPPS